MAGNTKTTNTVDEPFRPESDHNGARALPHVLDTLLESTDGSSQSSFRAGGSQRARGRMIASRPEEALLAAWRQVVVCLAND